MSTRTKTVKANQDYSVAAPESIWVVVGPRGGITVHKASGRAYTEWRRLQTLRDDQLARGIDVGTEPMLVEYAPKIASALTKSRQ